MWKGIKMKKFLKLVAATAMACSLVACSSGTSSTTTTEEETGAYKAGTYTATAAGMDGDVTVEVVFTSDAIESVTVTEQNETEGVGTLAVDQLPGKIVEAQSLAVDAITGATVTSTAIIEAVKDCVEQAGGDVDALLVASEEESEKAEETLDADVVIVGGGASGMTAAIRSAELGLNVILVEKTASLGGAVALSGGNQVVMGSQMQKDLGVTDDSVESMVEDFKANGANLNVDELITLYATYVGEASDYLESVGVTYDTESGLHQLAEYAHNRELAYTGGGTGAGENFRKAVDASGATVLLNTRATELITENGAVTGIVAEGEDTNYTINAKAVLLATGGYGANKDLLSDELASALYYGPSSSTGDGIIMATAEGVDAATRLMEYGKRYPNGVEVSEGVAKSTINGNIAAWKMSAILVNKEGSRVVNEKASNRTILEVELEQTGSELFLVLDAETFAVWSEKIEGNGISSSMLEGYLEANGSTTPVFAHGDTLAEAAEAAGIDADALEATVERYNSFVESGVDEDFGRSAEYMTMAIGDGPYYIIEQKPRFATTMGGLVINTDLQVQNTSDETIVGLYAAGETVGGVMGDDSPSGANNGWAVTSGYLAAASIADFVNSAE